MKSIKKPVGVASGQNRWFSMIRSIKIDLQLTRDKVTLHSSLLFSPSQPFFLLTHFYSLIIKLYWNIEQHKLMPHQIYCRIDGTFCSIIWLIECYCFLFPSLIHFYWIILMYWYIILMAIFLLKYWRIAQLFFYKVENS